MTPAAHEIRAGEIVLLLGGARSGKSRMAQARAEALPGELVYLATGEARDEEMTARIDKHRADRGARWRTVEVPLDLAGAIRREGASGNAVGATGREAAAGRYDVAARDGGGAGRGGAAGRDGAPPGRVLLVDCLTLWLSNLMLGEHDVSAATDGLLAALGEVQGTVLLVSNEVGMGIVPENALARRFRDEAGRLNQRVAVAATEVLLVAAGLAVRMK